MLANVEGMGEATSKAAAMRLLRETGVASVPGGSFFVGPDRERFIRFCFAKQLPELEEGCRRLARFDGRGNDGSPGMRARRRIFSWTAVAALLAAGDVSCDGAPSGPPAMRLRERKTLSPAWSGSASNVPVYREQSSLRLSGGAHATPPSPTRILVLEEVSPGSTGG